MSFKSLPMAVAFITAYTTTLDGLNKIVSAQMVSDALIANADRFKDMITVDGDSVTSRATSILSSGCYAGDFEIVTVELLLKQPIYIQFTNNNHYNVLCTHTYSILRLNTEHILQLTYELFTPYCLTYMMIVTCITSKVMVVSLSPTLQDVGGGFTLTGRHPYAIWVSNPRSW